MKTTDVLDRLGEWRKFPGYSLERRMDVFISFYLKGILALKNINVFEESIVPEFPLKANDVNRRSIKVDFLCYSKNCIYFVELKTDAKSKKDEQIDKYLTFKNWKEIKAHLSHVREKTDYLSKYDYLQKHLEKHNVTDQTEVKLVYIAPTVAIESLKLNTNYSGVVFITLQEVSGVIRAGKDKNNDVERKLCVILDSIEQQGPI